MVQSILEVKKLVYCHFVSKTKFYLQLIRSIMFAGIFAGKPACLLATLPENLQKVSMSEINSEILKTAKND